MLVSKNKLKKQKLVPRKPSRFLRMKYKKKKPSSSIGKTGKITKDKVALIQQKRMKIQVIEDSSSSSEYDSCDEQR